MPPRQRHIPQRRCAACGQTGEKRGLLRVVRTPEGEVRVDPAGRANGRGAYVHLDPACIDAGVQRGRLEHSLKVRLDRPAREALAEALRKEQGAGGKEHGSGNTGQGAGPPS